MNAKKQDGEDGDESIFEITNNFGPRESTISDLNNREMG